MLDQVAIEQEVPHGAADEVEPVPGRGEPLGQRADARPGPERSASGIIED